MKQLIRYNLRRRRERENQENQVPVTMFQVNNEEN